MVQGTDKVIHLQAGIFNVTQVNRSQCFKYSTLLGNLFSNLFDNVSVAPTEQNLHPKLCSSNCKVTYGRMQYN